MLGEITGLVSTLAFFAVVAAIIIAPQYFKARDRERMHETLRIAYEKGQPVPPELITALQTSPTTRPMDTPERDLRRAIVLIAVGLGLVGLGCGIGYGLMSVDDTAAYTSGGSIAGAGAIPGLIGVAYLILYFTRRRSTKV